MTSVRKANADLRRWARHFDRIEKLLGPGHVFAVASPGDRKAYGRYIRARAHAFRHAQAFRHKR